MRRGVVLFLLLLFAFLAFAIHTVWTLLSLLVVSGAADAITKEELPALGSSRTGTQPHVIPKILHQTWRNETIPAVWRDAQQSCLDLHSEEDGWEYMLWTDEKMETFMQKEYEWFMDTFDAYPYGIMRADAIRYFVLYHYGGVYLDLDDGCNRAMEPLLGYPAWVRKTIPTGISNDVMGAAPGHPFFKRVIDELKNYDRNWILPYITVMGSTGPLFLSVIWRHYSSDGFNEGDGRIRILFPDEYQGTKWAFFKHNLGNSWHGADVQFIFWVSLLHLLHFRACLTNPCDRWPAIGSSSPSLALYWASASYSAPGGHTIVSCSDSLPAMCRNGRWLLCGQSFPSGEGRVRGRSMSL